MLGNSVSSSGLELEREWENLAVCTGKPVEFQQQTGFSMSSSGSNAYCGDHLVSHTSSEYLISGSPGSTKEAMDGFPKVQYKNMRDDVQNIIPPLGASACSAEPMTGLRLGRHNEHGDRFAPSACKPSMPSLTVSSMPAKRSRASYQNMQNPRCQVEGCNLDLKSAKDYHRRHRICERHSKSPKVVVAGKERRFCQQCSRFHDLSEFDDKKRSCRRRLSDHNARRRRVQPESIHLSPAGQSSVLYDQRPQNILLNGLPISLSSATWEYASTSPSRQTRDSLIRPSKAEGRLESRMCFSADKVRSSISNLHMDSERFSPVQCSNPCVLDQCLHVHTSNSPMAPNLLSAFSLLSSNPWSLNEGQSSLMEGLVHGNYNPVLRHTDSETQNNSSLFESNNIYPAGGGGGGPASLMHSGPLHNAGNSQLQEFQLFKAPFDCGAFFTAQRNS